ncbi:hypothetical protein ACJH6J_09195 [Mycobacterium sp. SMC-18]|uniref:hypothetical protein n=1 Tax=unclassified Mycobacterium TaxID=2642494 RepID=UPI0038763AC6
MHREDGCGVDGPREIQRSLHRGGVGDDVGGVALASATDELFLGDRSCRRREILDLGAGSRFRPQQDRSERCDLAA